MIITKIKRIASTNRYHLYADEQWQGIFLDEILAIYKLKTDQEIDEDEFAKIKKENDRKVSFDMAVCYMEKYVVSQNGIKDYLKKKGFGDNTISATIDKLKDYGYVDDEKFARNYFDSLTASKGKRAIANKLREKGIAKEIIDDLVEEIEDEDEISKATVLAEKFAKNREKSLKNKQKCLAHLVRKGYDYTVAQQATNNVFNSYEGENDDWI